MKFLFTSSILLAASSGSIMVANTLAESANLIIEQSSDGQTLTIIERETRDDSHGLLRTNTDPSPNNPTRLFKGTTDEEDKYAYTLDFKLSNNLEVICKTNPVTNEVSIKAVDRKKSASIGQDDRTYLKNIQESLIKEKSIDTSTVETMPTQVQRCAGILSEWPETLELDYVFNIEKDQARLAAQAQKQRSVPSDAPDVPGHGRNLKKYEATSFENGESEHDSHRRLAYTSLCANVNTFYPVTHDDLWYDNWEDETTFYAYLSMDAAGECDDGTYFWTGSQWRCYEPDHDPNIEYAYGDCFGRCGAGCGSDTQFTVDCANHDSCVRFGHSTASAWCNDEFSYCIDDKLFAPNCL